MTVEYKKLIYLVSAHSSGYMFKMASKRDLVMDQNLVLVVKEITRSGNCETREAVRRRPRLEGSRLQLCKVRGARGCRANVARRARCTETRGAGPGARRSPASRLALHAAGPRHSLPPQSSLWVSRRVELVDVGRHSICLSASRCVYGPVRMGFAGAFAAVFNAEPTAVLEIACVIIVTSAATRRDSARSPAPARRLTRARPLQPTISGARH
ncbi:unnamed protein product [Pieris macdunnoughi]|uniref:Uncharacterized protein n=1 Tax=Pieris macdunnoughi TaxID=345717 RepID=A0A821UA84_9NEOP|nr:unnamed protein product [Pieris macdunnoughi]